MRNPLIMLAIAAALVAPAAFARTFFAGNACSLVAAKQVKALGIPGACKPTTLQGPGFTDRQGVWGSGAGPHLSVAVNTYPSKNSAWHVAIKALGILPGGASKKVSGIGSVAYEGGANGSNLSAINFVVGNQIVNISLRTARAQKSFGALNAIATSVAAKL